MVKPKKELQWRLQVGLSKKRGRGKVHEGFLQASVRFYELLTRFCLGRNLRILGFDVWERNYRTFWSDLGRLVTASLNQFKPLASS